jgi:lipopolysaccharide/colanic/teichoic acid biosynthesis glycosyltransferase
MEVAAERREQDQTSYVVRSSATMDRIRSGLYLLHCTLKQVFGILFAIIGIIALIPALFIIAVCVAVKARLNSN